MSRSIQQRCPIMIWLVQFWPIGIDRSVTDWMVHGYPTSSDVHGRNLSQTLEQGILKTSKYCKKRSGGAFVQKAPACRKSDLHALLKCAFKYASSPSDNLDALLLSWLWYLFGRSSDLIGVGISGISIYPGGALIGRFRRPKTADECGLSLFRNKDSMELCPIYALAVALVMKTGLDDVLMSQVPRPQHRVSDEDTDLLSVPLHDLLNEEVQESDGGIPRLLQPTMSRVSGVASPAVHGYVNRLLLALNGKIVSSSTITNLTSHSFRRGGVHHANGDPRLAASWILDLGSWNMTSTNKGFAYIVNTTREDQRVAKSLSGWDPFGEIRHVDLSPFDPVVKTTIQQLQTVLFSGCSNLQPYLMEVLTATIIVNYPDMIDLQETKDTGGVKRVCDCLAYCQLPEREMLVWSSFLRGATASTKTNVAYATEEPVTVNRHKASSCLSPDDESKDFIRLLIDQNRQLLQRIDSFEDQIRALSSDRSLPTPTLPR